MSDETVPAPPPSGVSDETGGNKPTAGASDERKIFGKYAPMGFVYGGTHTSAHDKKVAMDEAEAERRRDMQDAERRIADRFGPHRGNPANVAKQYTSQMTDHPEIMKAYVPLVYYGKNHKEVEFEGVGDIVMPQDPAFDNELMLVIFCPKCKEGGMPAGQCILQIRQSNRKWELDTRTAGEMFVFEGKAYRSAGRVMAGEPFTCAQCNWRARIDDNRVLPL